MNVFKSLVYRFRGLLLLTLIASALSAAASIALINEINNLITAPEAFVNTRIGMAAALLVALFVCGFGSQALLTAFGHRIVYELRMVMVKRVLDTGVEQQEQIGAPALYASLTKDIMSIGEAFNRLPFVLYNGILVAGSFIYLAWLSWQLFLLSAVVIGLGAGLAQVLMMRMRALMKIVRDTDDRIYAGYEGAIDGRYELALNAWRKRRFYERDFEPAVEMARATEVSADRYWTLSLNLTITIILGLTFGIFIAGAAFGIPSANVIAYVLVLMFLRTPLNDLVGGLPALLTGSVALSKIDSLSLEPYQPGFNVRSEKIETATGDELLALENVVYEYPHEGGEYGFRLGPVNLRLRTGEMLFIVGGNGSGKSTLAKILTGLYHPSSGLLRLNGVAVTDNRLAWYRSHFSTVFSSFHLFERLVGPRGEFDPALAQAFLERLRMERKVAIDGDCLSTTRLSQGQRKRLALLTAYVEQRPILLLDEWAADQDPVFRSFFYFELLPELKRCGKTIIAISHDDRYFGIADRVLKCESGVLREYKPTVSVQEAGAQLEAAAGRGESVLQ
ncbi:cyclic peptide export ABC transporter [Nitrococcus mobilis]|uniref:Putative ABC transporter ATP-binding protein n=1 Tax=Nitrococcus mobilis Nb-231 TaxID=314278 RepID=A4BRG9_9GAMM|nr:cyclic peptide export ABC transporter [Nitrococcus mobilis]EAR21791.1 putative ABC transporter ATP-binding protein [Nitrococcus mobilis Nb-231]